MNVGLPRLAGVELYFDDLPAAKTFYQETLGLKLSDEQRGHYAKFESGPGFVCLERKGSETYPSQDKAVLFFEVSDLQGLITAIGKDRFVQTGSGWAVLHDPEGHNILFLEPSSR
jgi:predicted enzyme related to lactoylglutathione lyase